MLWNLAFILVPIKPICTFITNCLTFKLWVPPSLPVQVQGCLQAEEKNWFDCRILTKIENIETCVWPRWLVEISYLAKKMINWCLKPETWSGNVPGSETSDCSFPGFWLVNSKQFCSLIGWNWIHNEMVCPRIRQG